MPIHEGGPLTGEPDALIAPVRFGGRGDRNKNGLPYPIMRDDNSVFWEATHAPFPAADNPHQRLKMTAEVTALRLFSVYIKADFFFSVRNGYIAFSGGDDDRLAGS